MDNTKTAVKTHQQLVDMEFEQDACKDWAAEWAAAHPAQMRALEREGYRMHEVQVLRILDSNEGAKWWAREHVVLGAVLAPFDGPTPMDERALLAKVAADFGPDAEAIY